MIEVLIDRCHIRIEGKSGHPFYICKTHRRSKERERERKRKKREREREKSEIGRVGEGGFIFKPFKIPYVKTENSTRLPSLTY